MRCQCTPPRPTTTPNNAGSCLKCGRPYRGPGVLEDADVAAFYNDLGQAIPSIGPAYRRFAGLARTRKGIGDKKYGPSGAYNYLGQDNITEAEEEATDGANYCMFEQACLERAGRPRSNHLQMAALDFARAYENLLLARAEIQGTPSWRMDESNGTLQTKQELRPQGRQAHAPGD